MGNNNKIKTAPSTLSTDRMRALYNQNFLLMQKFMDQSKITAPVQNVNIVFPTNPVEGATYGIKYQNGQWIAVRNDIGTQYRFTGDESLLVGSKHQYIVYSDIYFEDDSNVVVEEGGQLILLSTIDSAEITP